MTRATFDYPVIVILIISKRKFFLQAGVSGLQSIYIVVKLYIRKQVVSY